MKIEDILPSPVSNQEAFILDHGKTNENGSLKYKDDMTSYGWNIKRFNKLHEGAYVLNRHPGKITKDRKFEIYSGGYVKNITEPDDNGNVIATITHAFTFATPLKQGESLLENFKWDSKKKKEGSWEHFWNQYGMNSISMKDFWALVKGQNCVPFDESAINDNKEDNLTDSEIQELEDEDEPTSGFEITVVENDGSSRREKYGYTRIARKIDFTKVQRAKNKTGKIGEFIILDMLTKKANQKGLKIPEQVSVTRGDGLGYDILAFDAVGNEIHIEVKTSIRKQADGFDITDNEVKESLVENSNYKIYRIYDLNIKTCKCKLKIYDGPIIEESFKLVPTSYKLYQK
ncbi:DUF3883 domain-containing protein [Fructilactobacillus carniphilus]|uniref:DUF3883 domain-containing protein n=1 Tax=Fructilactobacillus carniphilus TaxID=2940297 RepID=A0ABY5BWF9_9LACO|nr:DUF3883 domain-containing protein [Fructilactobacillus carniphilus]USS90814.1 DUF3883 domain-containing protein [Fructilactobacillus carniphilus]